MIARIFHGCRRLRCRVLGHDLRERTHYIKGSGSVHIKRCSRCGFLEAAAMTRAPQFPFPKAAR